MDESHARFEALEHQIQNLHQQGQALHEQTHTVTQRLRWWRGAALLLLGLGLVSWSLSSPSLQAQEEANTRALTLEQRVTALEKKLKYLTTSNDTEGRPWMKIAGANVRITNGTGKTGTVNGLGNLLVGYNELRSEDGIGGGDCDEVECENYRTGSHNVVIGSRQNFSSYGGLVVGYWNTISAPYAAVSGGWLNTASGKHAAVSGGAMHEARGVGALVGGGWLNTAIGQNSTICGDSEQTALSNGMTICGGIESALSPAQAKRMAGGLRVFVRHDD